MPSLTSTITLTTLKAYKAQQQPITMLTCYDASFASLCQQAGVECLLIGDSLGNVIQGHSSTVPVSIEAMVYHTKCVARAQTHCFLIADMPFGTYDDEKTAYINAVKLMQAGAHMVKLEGNYIAPIVQYLSSRGIAVCAHLGLTPQYVHALGGFKMQAKLEPEATALKQTALAMQHAGASMLLFECIPQSLMADLHAASTVPCIAIGAGTHSDGQVLVMYDILGLSGKAPKFSKNFLELALLTLADELIAQKSIPEQSQNLKINPTENQPTPLILKAIQLYVQAVKNKTFP